MKNVYVQLSFLIRDISAGGKGHITPPPPHPPPPPPPPPLGKFYKAGFFWIEAACI